LAGSAVFKVNSRHPRVPRSRWGGGRLPRPPPCTGGPRRARAAYSAPVHSQPIPRCSPRDPSQSKPAAPAGLGALGSGLPCLGCCALLSGFKPAFKAAALLLRVIFQGDQHLPQGDQHLPPKDHSKHHLETSKHAKGTSKTGALRLALGHVSGLRMQ
jgi:hypothetical protein